jgi:heterotetrameric sarcosine oxidase gamma subunit
MPMSYEFQNAHALDMALANAPADARDNHLAVRRACAIVLVLAAPGREVEAAALLVADAELQVRFSSPGEWLVLSDTHSPDALLTELQARLDSFAFVIDQSHGRVAMRLAGPDARRILANGMGIDLHPEIFPQGRAVNALCGHIAVNIAAVGPDTFELVVMRSFAESLFEDIRIMARCYPFSAGFSA